VLHDVTVLTEQRGENYHTLWLMQSIALSTLTFLHDCMLTFTFDFTSRFTATFTLDFTVRFTARLTRAYV
jgi:hypothetical protein